MRGLKKEQNFQSEEHFHDDWAKSVSVDEIDACAPFTGKTSPEYKAAVTMLGNVNKKKILILGCGLGEEAVYLALQGAKVTAIDISKGMLVATKKLAKKYKIEKKIIYKQMDAEKLLYTKESFDYVFGCNILHHIHLQKGLKEIKRVLKKKGVGVFSEPLAYNPLINMYRVMASKVRTDHEHPLKTEDLQTIQTFFPHMQHTEFQLCTLFIFVWFYIGERLHPNKIRYWKKIIIEADKYQSLFTVLYTLDNLLLRTLPYLRKYCWVTVIKVEK